MNSLFCRAKSTDDRFGPRIFKHAIILKEVAVTNAVGHNEDLKVQRILAHQIGDRGIGVDDKLVWQTFDAGIVSLMRSLECLAVGPVIVVCRQSVIRHVPNHRIIVAHFIVDRIPVQAVFLGFFYDLIVPLFQFIDGPTHNFPRVLNLNIPKKL